MPMIDPFWIESLNIDQLHAVPLEEPLQWLERVMRQVLVEDRAQEQLVDDVDQVLGLEEENTVGSEHGPHAPGHAVHVVGVGEDVEGRDHGGGTVLVADLRRQLTVISSGRVSMPDLVAFWASSCAGSMPNTR